MSELSGGGPWARGERSACHVTMPSGGTGTGSVESIVTSGEIAVTRTAVSGPSEWTSSSAL